MALSTHFLLSISMLLLSLVVIASAYDPKSYLPKHSYEKPKLGEYILSITIGVQGLIYCKSGNKLIPIEGAVARITCQAEDKYGYSTEPYSFLSVATDSKGYFFVTVSPYEIKSGHKLKECKAYFELSPMEDCDEPSDVNKGTSGAPLSDYIYHEDKKMNIFSVGPWFCTPKKKQEEHYTPKKEQEEHYTPKKEQEEHKPVSKGY